MTGMVRKALLIAAGFAVVASVASAGVPDPRFSTFDAVVVGNASGTPIGGVPAGFDVTVRDVSNAPLSGVTVTLNFSTSGMKVFSTQNAGTTVNCPAKSISRVTNGAGQVNFGARVAKFNNANTIEVAANGVVLGNVRGRSTDIDGTDGRTGLGDLALFSANLLSNPSAQQTDFDLNGTTGLGDLALFSAELLTGPTLSYCP
jgi:hypothetical protein